MDRDRYSGNCLFKVEAGNGEEEQKTILCGGGGGRVPHSSLRGTLERRWTSRFVVIGMYVRRTLKNEWKRKLYDSKKLRLVISEFLPPPPPPKFYCGRPAYKSPLNLFPRSAPETCVNKTHGGGGWLRGRGGGNTLIVTCPRVAKYVAGWGGGGVGGDTLWHRPLSRMF